jgi:O-antigen/teichoic acid export membrane protein
METSSLSYKTYKNISYSFIGFVVPIVFSVFITPVIVHKLGVAEYGVLILTNTIMGFLGLLD